MSAPLTPEQMIEKLNGAHKAMTDAVARQWRGDVALQMSIPARPDHDTDFLVCDPIREVMAALRALARETESTT